MKHLPTNLLFWSDLQKDFPLLYRKFKRMLKSCDYQRQKPTAKQLKEMERLIKKFRLKNVYKRGHGRAYRFWIEDNVFTVHYSR